VVAGRALVSSLEWVNLLKNKGLHSTNTPQRTLGAIYAAYLIEVRNNIKNMGEIFWNYRTKLL
jgi:hypothetical protein